MKRPEVSPLVLVADDYEDNREMYADYLRFSGFRVAEAKDGSEALQKAESLHPDVILMDLSMPVVDGWEATRRLKTNPATKAIPVVALTAHALATEERRARDAGCDAYISKPCLPETLVAEIWRVLEDAKGTAKAASVSRSGASAARPRKDKR